MSTVLVESSHSLPLIYVGVVFRSGAAGEPDDKAGLARVCARMLRRGALGSDGAALGAELIEQRIDELGADFGAYAGLGSTSVGCELVSRSLEPMSDMLATLLTAPSFDEQELGKLLRQTQAELVSARDEDSVLASRGLRRHLFDGHPHGRRVAGSLATLDNITRDDVAAFHRRHYTRANALVGVAGDIDEDRAALLAERLLAGLPEGQSPESQAGGYPAAEPEPPDARRLVIVDKAERSQTQLVVGTLGTHPHDDDHIALSVANWAFGGTFTSRLTTEVRGKRGWSYGASSHLSISRVREAFSMWTAPGAEDAAACLSLELELLEAWHARGIDERELRFCQDNICRSYAFEVETAKKRLHQKVERALLGLPDDYHQRYTERVRAVTLAEANEAVRRRIDPSKLWVSAVATDAELGQALRDAVPGLAQSLVEPFDLE
jgi:zinc protease